MKLTLIQLMAIMQAANGADNVFATAFSANLDMGNERRSIHASEYLTKVGVQHTQEGRYIRFKKEHNA